MVHFIMVFSALLLLEIFSYQFVERVITLSYKLITNRHKHGHIYTLGQQGGTTYHKFQHKNFIKSIKLLRLYSQYIKPPETNKFPTRRYKPFFIITTIVTLLRSNIIRNIKKITHYQLKQFQPDQIPTKYIQDATYSNTINRNPTIIELKYKVCMHIFT